MLQRALAADPKGLLFRTIGLGTAELTTPRLPQSNAYAIIGRPAAAAGITASLKDGGTLERVAAMANHSSTRIIQLHDRRADEVTLDEVERVLN